MSWWYHHGMASTETKELVVRLPVELHAEVKARAEHDDRSIAATIRIALRHYLKCHIDGGEEP